ncbi:MAG: glycosyltransferase family 9 protein [Maribacter arcticus]|uniref:glycosyltransferase family 9 protein n=1 Tax=Maribacter arcticus TaxID=561365 RepID=UPI003001C4BB
MANNSPVHILVIRLSAIGDVAMTVPVILGICKKYPSVKITVLTKPFMAPIFSDIPNVSVFNANVKGKHKGILGLWKLYKELANLQIHMVADLHHVLRSSILKKFFKLRAIPFIQIDKGRDEKKKLIDPKRVKLEPLKSTFKRYSEVFEKLGYTISVNEMVVLSKKSLPKDFVHLKDNQEQLLVGIAPFAAFKGKMYPLNLMKEVINKLNNTNKYKIILFGGGQQEVEILSTWDNQFNNVFSAAGKLSFSAELSLISNLRLMLAMDSGNAHLAAMFGVPTVTLWGVTHPYAGFFPFGQSKDNALLADRVQYPLIPTSIYGNKFPAGYENVMSTMHPTKVVQKIIEVINNNV